MVSPQVRASHDRRSLLLMLPQNEVVTLRLSEPGHCRGPRGRLAALLSGFSQACRCADTDRMRVQSCDGSGTSEFKTEIRSGQSFVRMTLKAATFCRFFWAAWRVSSRVNVLLITAVFSAADQRLQEEPGAPHLQRGDAWRMWARYF